MAAMTPPDRTPTKTKTTCGICAQSHLTPLALPCLHLYCAACLDDRFGASEVECPSCNEPGGCTGSDAAATLPLAAFAGRKRVWQMLLKDVENGSHAGAACIACDSQGVSAICGDCAGMLCDFCAEAHGRTTATRRHKVLGLGELDSYDETAIIPAAVQCPEHQEPLRWWCATCAKDGKGLKCAVCLTSHPAVFHVCEDIAIVVEREADEVISAAVRMVERTQSALAVLRQRLLSQAGAAAAVDHEFGVGLMRPPPPQSPRHPFVSRSSLTSGCSSAAGSPRNSVGASPSVAGGRTLIRRGSSGLVGVNSIHAEIDAFVDDLEDDLRRQRRVLHHQVYAAVEAARNDERHLDALLSQAEDASTFAARARQESCPAEFLLLVPTISARLTKLKDRAHQLRHGFLGAPALLPEIDQFRLLKVATPVAQPVAQVLSCMDLQSTAEAAMAQDASYSFSAAASEDGSVGAPATPKAARAVTDTPARPATQAPNSAPVPRRTRSVQNMLVQSNMAPEPVAVADSPLKITPPADKRERAAALAAAGAGTQRRLAAEFLREAGNDEKQPGPGY